jgi:hypothetical protein
MKKRVKLNIFGTKEKYDIVYFKYCTKYVYLSRIRINSGTWIYFYLYLYVARPFTYGNFGITGASEIFALDLCLMFDANKYIHVGGVRGPQLCEVLLGGPRTQNILNH